MRKNILLSATVLFLSKGYAQCPIPSLVTASPATVCSGVTTSLNATAIGASINWFTVPTGGTPIGGSPSGGNFTINPSSTTTFYAESVNFGGAITYSYTGAIQSVTIPAGVTQITVDARGAQGGTDGSAAPGGLGGKVVCIYPVVPGQVLNIYVGGVGGNTGGPGGFNGGGTGGSTGGAGGGASDIRIGGIGLANRVIVAGGGGGAGANCNTNTEYGGYGGGLTAGTGWECGTQNTTICGQGGSQVAGGLGATGYAVPSGSLGIGGSSQLTIWCGGGAGGYYGGGVGAYGGGGGGSSYTDPGALSVVHTVSFQPGNGQITISGLVTGCVSASRTPVLVTVNPSPTISVNSGTICSGSSFTILPSGANTYTFQGGNAVVSPTANTNYTVIGTSTAGCVSSGFVTSSVAVSSSLSLVVSGASSLVCPGSIVTLSASGATSYTWSTGATTSTVMVIPTTNTFFTVFGTSTISGCSGFSIKTVSVFPLNPIVALGGGVICQGQSINLAANGALSYTWQPGALIGFFVNVSPLVSTAYTVTGIDVNSCLNSAVTTVSVIICTGMEDNDLVENKSLIYPNPSNGEFCIISANGLMKMIEVTDITGSVVYQLNSSFDKVNINLKHLSNGIYFVKIISENYSQILKVVKE